MTAVAAQGGQAGLRETIRSLDARFGLFAALFSLKCFAAAVLAYYVALRIGLTRPYWAVATTYIVAQPLAGAVLSKAVFRGVGTIVGGGVAILLVPALVNSPELLSLALALWLGLCLYVSLLDRTPRAYVFLLAGYTASIIGFPSVTAPGAIFDTASARMQEIMLGILCASLIHGVIFPRTVVEQLLKRIDSILDDAERWSRDSLSHAAGPALDRDRRRLALDIGDLHQLSIHLPFDMARLLPRIRTVRAFQDQLSMLLPLASAIEDRLNVLAATGGIPRDVQALVEGVRDWLGRSLPIADRGEAAARLIARAQALEPAIAAPLDYRAAVRLNLLGRVADLVAAHRDCRDLSDQMRSVGPAPVTPNVADLLALPHRRPLHRDHGMALRTTAGTIATVLLGCAFWIVTGWKDGGGAVAIAGICCALFGSVDDPAPVIKTFLIGTVIGIVLAGFYAFVLFPQITAFPVLMLSMAPVLFIGGAILANPRPTLIAIGFLLGFLNVVGLNDRYAADFSSFVNGGVAQIVGTSFAVLCVQLFLTIGVGESARRLMRAGWRDLAERANSPQKPDIVGWISRMLDRIGLLAPRLAARREDPGRPLFDALADLRVGVSVGELRVLRAATPSFAPIITPVLRGVGDYFRRRVAREEEVPGADLLATIDEALAATVASAEAEVRRNGTLALISLRRNLFPDALLIGRTGA